MIIERKLGQSDNCLCELARHGEREEREQGGGEREDSLEKGGCRFQAAEKEIQLHEGVITVVGFGDVRVEGNSIKMYLECVVMKL